MKDYTPEPIDTRQIVVPEDLQRLQERLARHMHDVWAQNRLEEGWTLGPQRDDGARKHPCLVPYEDLPESEKEYDRRTAMETIKALLSFGCSIQFPRDAVPQYDEALVRLSGLLSREQSPPLSELLECWNQRSGGTSAPSSGVCAKLAEKLIKAGEYLTAWDVIDEGLKDREADVRLRQFKALALARSGATDKALAVLKELEKEGQLDEETLGLMGRVCKDLWGRENDPRKKSIWLDESIRYYRSAYDHLDGGYWSGINAATLSRIKGDAKLAGLLAGRVYEECSRKLECPGRDEVYWVFATLGEACLVLERWEEAVSWYTRAVGAAPGEYGSIASTRGQAALLIDHLEADSDVGRLLARCFAIPPVLVFAGHMVDHPTRLEPRFPSGRVDEVKAAIARRLREIDPCCCYASAACGSDILCHEVAREAGIESHVILPYDRHEFRRDSVEFVGDPAWSSRYDAVLSSAREVLTVSPQRLQHGGLSYDYANQVLQGLARMRARNLGTDLRALTVWDRRTGDGRGGTESIVGQLRQFGVPVDVITISDTSRVAQLGPLSPPVSEQTEIDKDEHAEARTRCSGRDVDVPFLKPKVRVMLFGDVVKFSRLTEPQLEVFVEQFMGGIANVLLVSDHKPVVKNTWGDGLYLVFKRVDDAGLFALELCDWVNRVDWSAKGLNSETGIRLGLHVGPVYSCKDPVTAVHNYMGSHVSRAARIEPVTPPGHVYASESFAALAEYYDVRGFACDYVGTVPLAKRYGKFPLYHVRRR